MGLITEPCGTPAFIYPGGESEFKIFILKERSVRKEFTVRIKCLGKSNFMSFDRRPACQTLSKARSISRKAAAVNFLVLKPSLMNDVNLAS